MTKGACHEGNVVLLRLFVVGGAGLAAVVVSALLLLGFGNRITRELTGFQKAVRALADERLPAVVNRLREGEDVDVDTEAPPLALRTRTREVTETADAFSAVQRTAVEAAVGQAQLRKGVSNVFRSLARRNQSLLQRQLKMLDEMERGTHDPESLAQLFRLDQLTTRMRRQAEGLIILSGAAAGRGWRQPVPVVEVLRGAIGEIEDYVRVDMVTESRDFIPGAAVADVTHLLAELIENATLYSPPQTRVKVSASRVANGYVVEIEDRGLGIPAETLAALNERLGKPPEFDLADSDQLGLFVVSRLAARHGIKISLRGSAYGGTAAIVLMPQHLVVAEEDAASQDARPAAAVAGLSRGVDTQASRRRPRMELDAVAPSPPAGNVQTQLTVRTERPGETVLPDQETTSRVSRHRGLRPRAAASAAPGQPGPAAPRRPANRIRGRSARGAFGRAGTGPDLVHPAGLAERPCRGRPAGRRRPGRERRGPAMTGGSAPGELNWLLENLVSTVHRVRQAVILSPDGLPLGNSPGLSADDADHLAALAAGVQSLARGAGQRFSGGEVRQTIIEMDAALLFITAAGQGTCLAVLADVDADAGLIAYEMAVLVKRVGQHMVANPRFPANHSAFG